MEIERTDVSASFGDEADPTRATITVQLDGSIDGEVAMRAILAALEDLRVSKLSMRYEPPQKPPLQD